MSTLFSFFATSKAVESHSSVFHLKNRLDWGEPALTIIDVRERAAFNRGRIMGAISIPADEMLTRPLDLAKSRDIYVYATDDAEAAEAAAKLRSMGYDHVSVLQGGLAAWKVAEGSIEGEIAPDSCG
jgi:rhodanese-related sulfurtransferase